MASFTRKAIMTVFLNLLEERPLSKITVKDIVDACGINRNTFYYHFEDIPALIEAMVKEETDLMMRAHANVDSVEDALEIAVNYILKHRRAALHIHQSSNRELYERYLMQLCNYVVETYFNALLADRNICDFDRAILIRSYRCWCYGLITDWLNEGLKDDIRPKLKRLCQLREGGVEEMLARCNPKE